MIPITFSAPGDSLEPTVEDALQLGVWLMMRADKLNARQYSYDSHDPNANVRIVMDQAAVDRHGSLTLPQQIVAVAFAANRFTYTIQGGKKTVSVGVIHLERPRTRYTEESQISVAPVTPAETPLMIYGRIEEILQRGTIYKPDMDEYRAIVVDPYRSQLYAAETAPSEELIGAYDQGSMVTLNRTAPDLSRTISFWPIPKTPPGGDWSKLNPLTDIAVGYGVTAQYEVTIRDRTNMRNGGSNG